MNHVKVSIYINEADKWEHRPLFLELLTVLDAFEVSGGTVLRAIAGFTYKKPVETASLVDVGSRMPLIVQFVDTLAKVDGVLPQLKAMVADRLIIREPVEVVNGFLTTGPIP
jgi:hypothetical protein